MENPWILTSIGELLAIVFVLICYLNEDKFIAFEERMRTRLIGKLRSNKRFMEWLDKPAETIGEDLPSASILKGWKKL